MCPAQSPGSFGKGAWGEEEACLALPWGLPHPTTAHLPLCRGEGLHQGGSSPPLQWAKAGCYIWPGGAVPVKLDAAVLCKTVSWSQWGRLVLATAAVMRGAETASGSSRESTHSPVSPPSLLEEEDDPPAHRPAEPRRRGRPSSPPASRATAKRRTTFQTTGWQSHDKAGER